MKGVLVRFSNGAIWHLPADCVKVSKSGKLYAALSPLLNMQCELLEE